MTQPTPADVAATLGTRPATPGGPLPDLPANTSPRGAVDLEEVEDLPPHLQVVDHVEDVLELVGPHSRTADPPRVTVHLSHGDHDVQRDVLRRVLAWPGASCAFPSQEARGARAIVKFNGTRPQLSVVFDAAAVGHQVQRSDKYAPARWVLDEELVP